MQSLFLGVQPILDRQHNVHAYELLFRSSLLNRAQIENDVTTSAAVIRHAFADLGVDAVLGPHSGSINVSSALLMSDAIEALPADRIILELSAASRFSEALIQRCGELKRKGFGMILDNVVAMDPAHAPFRAIADMIKVDVAELTSEQLRALTLALSAEKARKIAARVETREQSEHCLALGYEFLQGNYFKQPVILTGKRLSSSEIALLQLLGLAASDAQTGVLENAFKHHPDLTLQLLKLVNSAGTRTAVPIESVDKAITVLGRRQLNRWLQILVFASSGTPGVEYPSPLLVLAAVRGRLMELIAGNLLNRDRTFQDHAFMAGMLSLMSTHFGVQAGDILDHLPVAAQIKEAVLDRGGILGNMLMLMEMLEQPEFEAVDFLLNDLEAVNHENLMRLQVDAVAWANSLGG